MKNTEVKKIKGFSSAYPNVCDLKLLPNIDGTWITIQDNVGTSMTIRLSDLSNFICFNKEAEQTEWIPVSEKLPNDRNWYLGIFKETDTGWINPLPFICDYVGRKTKATTKDEIKVESEPQKSEKYCDRNICVSNEYNSIRCDECEVTKSQKSQEENKK